MIYAQFNAAGQPVEIVRGLNQPIYRIRVANTQESVWTFTPIGEYVCLPEPLMLSPVALDHYGPEDFDRYGITAFDDPIPPEGKLLQSYTFDLNTDGVIELVSTFVDAPQPTLPSEVPMYKVKKFLIIHKAQTGQDLDLAITNYIESLDEPNRSLALVDWNRSPNLVTNAPLATAAKAALNLTDDQYKALILAAAATP